jgi:phosphoserine phosphatase RsbU/P
MKQPWALTPMQTPMPESNRKILVIDDDSVVRMSLVAYLSSVGFDVVDADNGAEGLSLFSEISPDLVLTDLRMPDVDGLQVLARVGEVSPDTPVIVISGAGEVSDVVDALRLGAADYLVKPLVDMQVLKHAVDKSLEGLALREENHRYREELEASNTALTDHLRALEMDQQAGRRVQQKLLPPSPFTRQGYLVQHKVIPSLYLSGDFIDYAYVSERYLSFYLVDVSGHGASSALATIWLKHLAIELMAEFEFYRTPSDFEGEESRFLRMVNDRLLESRLGHHMTCFSGVVDLHTGRFRYCLAGHLPMPVLIEPGEKPRFLSAKGRPLGLFPDQSWPMQETVLKPGAQLLGFSDGVLEVMPAKDLLQKEEALLKQLSGSVANIDEIIDALGINEVEEAPDDIAIFSITRGKQDENSDVD